METFPIMVSLCIPDTLRDASLHKTYNTQKGFTHGLEKIRDCIYESERDT